MGLIINILKLFKFQAKTAKTKTFLLGLITLVGGVTILIHCYINGNWDQAESGVTAIIAGMGLMTGRDAITKLTAK